MACQVLEAQRIFRGDTLKLQYTFKEDGVILDITGWEVKLTVRLTPAPTSDTTDVDAILTSLADIPVGTDGIANFNITPEQNTIDPTEYKYDVQYKNVDGDIRTVGTGRYIVDFDVTRSE